MIPLSNGTVDDCAISASCPSQDSELNSIYTRSAVCCNLGTLLFGYLMDRFGTWNSRLVACIMVTGGSGMLSIATPETSYFIKFGMYLLATGGIGFLGWFSILIADILTDWLIQVRKPSKVTNMQIGRLFPARRALIITIINGLYGTSAAVPTIIKLILRVGVFNDGQKVLVEDRGDPCLFKVVIIQDSK